LAFFFQLNLNVLFHCLLTAMFSGEKPTVYFIEDGIKGIREGTWL
jgi:hypothetical protein